MKDSIQQWEELTNTILKNFLSVYFDDNDPYYFWVGSEIGGVVCYGDFFFNFWDIITCNKLSVSEKQFFEWCFSNLKNSTSISLEYFIMSPKRVKEQQEKHLSELKERVRLAEEEFNKAIEQYKI